MEIKKSFTKSLLFFTKHGLVKRTNLAHFFNIRSLGVKAIKLDEEDELVTAKIADSESEHIAIFTTFGKVIRFSIDEVREMGRNTRGVIGIKFGEKDDYVVDGIVLKSEDGEILTVSENGLGKRTKISEYRVTKRGGKGIISMKLTNRTGKRVIGAVEVESDRDLMVLTETGKIIRISFDEVAITSRNTSGVILVKGDKVVSISTSPKDEIDN